MSIMNRKNPIDPRTTEPPWLQNGPFQWQQFQVNYRNFFAAATTGNLDLTGYQAGTLILGMFFRNRANYTGPSIATATLSAGTVASPAAYVAATTVFSGAPSTLVGITQVPGTFVNATTPTAAGTIRIQLVVTGANTSVLLTGATDVFVYLGAAKLYFGG